MRTVSLEWYTLFQSKIVSDSKNDRPTNIKMGGRPGCMIFKHYQNPSCLSNNLMLETTSM